MLLCILIIITLNFYLINCLLPYHLVLLEKCFFVFSTLDVKLINDITLNCNQQPGLSTTRWGRVIPVDRAIASSQADATWTGVFFRRRMAPAVWGMTQHRGLGSYSFSSLPRVTNPRLSSSVCSLHCHPSARAQGKWLQTKFCGLAL